MQNHGNGTVESARIWDSSLTAALIHAVKVRPEFWDHKHPGYLQKTRHFILQQQIIVALKEAYPEKTTELNPKGMYHGFSYCIYIHS